MHTTNSKDILIVGGYGVVGRRIAAQLAPRFPGRVLVAGRDVGRAAALTHELGHGSRPQRLDVDDPASISDGLATVGTIVMCVTQHEPHVLRAAIDHGLAYTDITPRLAFWQRTEAMADTARRTGARIVLGAGLSPGISNMMACKLARSLAHCDRIETAILLSVGDEYGPDSMRHVLESAAQSFTVHREGQNQPAIPFSSGVRVAFPEPLGARTAYLFPWSDVVHYPATLAVRTAIGRFALEPAWLGTLIAVLVRLGARRWLLRDRSRQLDRGFLDPLKRRYRGHDQFALVVTAEGNGQTLAMSIAGQHQADATAAGAAEFARALAAEEVREPGVWLPEQVFSHDRFFAAMASLGLSPTLTEQQPKLAIETRTQHS